MRMRIRNKTLTKKVKNALEKHKIYIEQKQNKI